MTGSIGWVSAEADLEKTNFFHINVGHLLGRKWYSLACECPYVDGLLGSQCHPSLGGIVLLWSVVAGGRPTYGDRFTFLSQSLSDVAPIYLDEFLGASTVVSDSSMQS